MSDVIDRWAARNESVVLLLGRLALVAIFVESGWKKVAQFDAFSSFLESRGVPAPGALTIIGMCVEIAGTVAVVLGWKTRYGAVLLALFTAIAALIAHDFWNLADAARATQHIHFMKNLAIVGGFLVLFVAGPGRYSLDRRGW